MLSAFVLRFLALAALCLTFGCSDDHSPIKPRGETISTPGTPAGPISVPQGDSATFTATVAASSLGDTLEYRFQSATGPDEDNPEVSAWSRDTSVVRSWPAPGSYRVRAQARCATHTSVFSSWSAPLTVDVMAEDVSVPTQPSGPTTANDGEQKTYTTGGSVSSRGHAVQYRMSVVDPTNEVEIQASGWSSTPSFQFTWPAAGTFTVTAQARCARDTLAISDYSTALVVTVQPPGPPVVTAATLGFVEAGADQVPLILHKVLGAWNEGDLTWNLMPALSDSIGTSAYFVDCNYFITCATFPSFGLDPALVQGWVDGTTTNYGLAITPGTTAIDVSFVKREAVTVYPSRVDITWHYQGESLTRHKTILLSADTYTHEGQPTTNFNSAADLITGRAGGVEKRIFVKFDASLP